MVSASMPIMLAPRHYRSVSQREALIGAWECSSGHDVLALEVRCLCALGNRCEKKRSHSGASNVVLTGRTVVARNPCLRGIPVLTASVSFE